MLRAGDHLSEASERSMLLREGGIEVIEDES